MAAGADEGTATGVDEGTATGADEGTAKDVASKGPVAAASGTAVGAAAAGSGAGAGIAAALRSSGENLRYPVRPKVGRRFAGRGAAAAASAALGSVVAGALAVDVFTTGGVARGADGALGSASFTAACAATGLDVSGPMLSLLPAISLLSSLDRSSKGPRAATMGSALDGSAFCTRPCVLRPGDTGGDGAAAMRTGLLGRCSAAFASSIRRISAVTGRCDTGRVRHAAYRASFAFRSVGRTYHARSRQPAPRSAPFR